MTRNERRAQNRRLSRNIRVSDVAPLPTMEPTRRTRIVSERTILEAMRGPQTRRPKPRGTWHQPGWSDTSPYYRTMTTIDRRWDK